jgi:hypothetical protein
MAQKKEDELLYDPQEGVAGGGSKADGSAASGTGQSAAGKSSGGGTQIKYGDNFTYQSAPDYVSKYQDQIDKLTESLLNRDKFTYDPETDPLYQQYADTYTRNGQRAMQDALGQVSARTGGLASSYAASAAQQTYDNYMTELADKIPELRQLAYSMYMDDYNTQRGNLELLNALEQGDFGKYQSLLNQYNADRNFQYGVYADDRQWDYAAERDKIADERYDREWEYNVGRDQLADERYDQEWNYALERDQIADDRYNTEWNYNLERDKLADQRYDREWNYNVQRDNIADRQYYAQQANASSQSKRTAAQEEIDAILAMGGMPSDSLLSAAGYSQDYIAALKDYYGSGNEAPPQSYSDYVNRTGDNGIYTEQQFLSARSSGRTWYSSYQEYLDAMYQQYLDQ